MMEFRELLSSIVVTSSSGGQNYASNVTFSQLDPTHTTVTLRDAVNAANNSSGADTISFDVGIFPPNTPSPTTIVLAGGTPLQFTDTSGATTIDGPGASQVAVSGDNQNTAFLINVGVTVAIDGLTIMGGKGSIDIGGGLKGGGGLFNNGRLTLQDVFLTGNAAGNSGGGFYNNTTGTVTVLGSTITGNSGVFGGGFFNAGTANVTNSTIADNSVTSNGGGFYNLATVNLNGSTLARNSAGVNGGGFFSNNTANVVNSTLTGNSAGSNGGGFINLKTANIIDSTIARNFATQGAGIFNSVGTVTLSGTILAQNTISAANSTPRDWGGLAASAASSYSLIGDGTATGLVNGTNHNLVGTAANLVNPLLAALGDYGGPVQTMALLPGSVALAAGATFNNPTNGQAVATDQRGVSRSSASSDIGAYQSAGFALAQVSGDNQSAIIDQVFASPLVVQLIEKAFGKSLRSSGVVVNFTAPINSASASLSAGSVATNANGQASVTAQANGTIGGPYDVVASASGVDAVAFVLTNLKVPSQIPSTPTVDSLTTTNVTPTLTGTWDGKNAVILQVTITNAATSYAATYTFGTDPQLSTSGNTWTLNLSTTTPLAVGSFSVVVHTENDIGQISDSAAGSLVINSTPPIVGTLNAPSANVGVPVNITTQILGGDLTGLVASIDWGDGTTSTGTIATVNGVLTVTGSHAYAASGSFNVALTVTNATGLSATAASTASITTSVPSGADLQVIRSQNVQIVAMNASASYDFDVQFVSGGVKLIGANGTTFNGLSTLFVANVKSVSGQLGSGDDHVRVSGSGRNFILDMGGGLNDVSVRNFAGQKLQVSSDGALGFHAWNSQMSLLHVTASTTAADFVQLSGIRVSEETFLKLGGGANRVQIEDSTFENFKLQSRGLGSVVEIEAGQADGTKTRFNGTAMFVVGGDSEITMSPLATSDQTKFSGRLIICAGSPDATWTRTNVSLASRPQLYNVDVVGPRIPVPAPRRGCR